MNCMVAFDDNQRPVPITWPEDLDAPAEAARAEMAGFCHRILGLLADARTPRSMQRKLFAVCWLCAPGALQATSAAEVARRLRISRQCFAAKVDEVRRELFGKPPKPRRLS